MATAYAQRAKLEGYVVNDGGKRMPNIKIVAAGGQAVTDSRGHFVIVFPPSISSGMPNKIRTDSGNWVVIEPFGGECITQDLRDNKSPLKVTIIQRGSRVALSHDNLRKLVRRLSKEKADLVSEKARMRGQIAELKSQREAALSRARDYEEYDFIKDYAKEYGLTPENLRDALRQWANSRGPRDTDEDRALKEYYKKNLTLAAQLAHESGLRAMERVRQLDKQKEEAGLSAARSFMLEGYILLEQNKFREALTAYERVDDLFIKGTLSKENYKREWAEAKAFLGTAKALLANRIEGGEDVTLMTEAIKEYEQALTVFTQESSSDRWEKTLNNLGNALSQKGGWVEGEEGVSLLTRAIELFEQVMTVRRSGTSRRDLAITLDSFGNALSAKGEILGGEESVRLQTMAIEAYREALTIRTFEAPPQDWASTLHNMGVALYLKARLSRGRERFELHAQAIDAYKKALAVRTFEVSPDDWAKTQVKLGDALLSSGMDLGGEKGFQQVNQAADVFKLGLTFYTRKTHPQSWAGTQAHLAAALFALGVMSGGEDGVRLLAQAVDACRDAVAVITREAQPEKWTVAQQLLGAVLFEWGKRVEGEERKRRLTEAVVAFQQLLTVNTREKSARRWAQTHSDLGELFTLLEDFQSALRSYGEVLAVNPREDNAYQAAAYINHDILYNYTEAFRLNQQRLRNIPDNLSARASFAENLFTIGQFIECEQHIAALLNEPKLEADVNIALRGIEIANLLAIDKEKLVPSKLASLITAVASQPASFRMNWKFNGTRHFIEQHKKISSHRAWLKQLFDAIEGGERETILVRLKETQANFKK
ncbi:MAG TPA: hypothetical protein VGB73_11245 [Pyrinomonadaceae bacterium]